MQLEQIEIYTKLEYEQDMRCCNELKREYVRAGGEGFDLLAYERRVNNFADSCKKRWARSQALLGALRISKLKLEKAITADEIDRLTKRINFLKLLASKILEGTDRVKPEPEEKPIKWPWIRMVNGWQRVEQD